MCPRGRRPYNVRVCEFGAEELGLGNVATGGTGQADELPGGVQKKREVLRNRVAQLVKPLLPEAAVREIRQYRAFQRAERPLYCRIRIMTALGLTSRRLAPATARSFLFVCFGNIMRSPMCEML